MNAFPANNQQQINNPQNRGQQPPYGQQWNAAPNFTPQGIPGQAGQPGQKPADPKKGTDKKSKKKGNGSIVGWIFLGIFLMLGLAALGAYLGYNTAIKARQAEHTRLSAVEASKQYQLALVDVENGKYGNAKTRLDYIQEIDPNYPGIYELMVQVNLALYPTASPTPMMTATPAPTPTADTRGEEEMFRGIQQSMYNQDWSGAIEQINALRTRNISFRGLEVDSMYYIALRNYGMQQINMGYLENGVYNITLAESFGPIDANANSLRDAARSYLSGAGFWEINWSRALEMYANAAMNYPNLMDRATMMTANQRYAEASFAVANEYVAREDFCGAIPYYQQALPIAGTENIQMTATAVYLVCYPPVPTDVPQTDTSYTNIPEMVPIDEMLIGDDIYIADGDM